MEEGESQVKQNPVQVFIEQKTGKTLGIVFQRALVVVLILACIVITMKWVGGDSGIHYKKMYNELHKENLEILKDNIRLVQSIDTLRIERAQMMVERDVAVLLLKNRPKQINNIIKGYEETFSHIDSLPLDSIAMYFSEYTFDDSSLSRIRSYLQQQPR